MQDLHQLQLIIKALEIERNKSLREVGAMNKNIAYKRSLSAKMTNYLAEYQNSNNLNLSRTIPSLNKNIYTFSKQIEAVIEKTAVELAQLMKMREVMMEKYAKINSKLDLMRIFEEKLMNEANKKVERLEQVTQDDLAALKYRGKKNE